MGWIWTDDDDDDGGSVRHRDSHRSSSSDGGLCATRKVIKSQCRTEEVEPGRFMRKCEKIEEVLKDCVGRPTEVVQSNKEYTEEDVTHQMSKGSFAMESPGGPVPFDFPGLRSDIESIERSLFSSFGNFFKAAEELTNDFYSMFGTSGSPHVHEGNVSRGSSRSRGIRVEAPEGRPSSSRHSDGDVDLSGFSSDV
ncbi:OLC1v1034008C1 [Oldenlandia corymbosa var. corymbosa]|uniref:OLC1v1034008C1 n=1 Tax=Oldenlandia corymbosa var. corymbosa TaxID=529605 RepID=A0AAV1CQA5_OLDCO|nr:OLC1v1034008C1 [Oldenlandia corymbosa var. corymbosa]